MSQEKVMIPTDNIYRMASLLRELASIADKACKDLMESESPGVEMDGWPTLAKAIADTRTQLYKIAGPTSRCHLVKAEEILLPNQTMPGKRKEDAANLKASLEKRISKKRQK